MTCSELGQNIHTLVIYVRYKRIYRLFKIPRNNSGYVLHTCERLSTTNTRTSVHSYTCCFISTSYQNDKLILSHYTKLCISQGNVPNPKALI